uniref:Bm11217 n=1 Tax=Brugia malayi TaxID=6279 RepID=A0A1I9G8S6_BRUMA|nr:Bm11217 [Brugia malayi]
MPNKVKDLEVGTSPGYIKAAYYLLSSMNQTVNPCDDFFEYACGRWVSEHPIPSDLGAYEVSASIREKVALKMKELYDSKQSTTSKAMDTVKTIYKTCMDTNRLQNMQGREIAEAIEKLQFLNLILAKICITILYNYMKFFSSTLVHGQWYMEGSGPKTKSISQKT